MGSLGSLALIGLGKASDALLWKEDSCPGGSLREMASTFEQQPAANVNEGRFTPFEGNAYCVGDSAPTARSGLILIRTVPIVCLIIFKLGNGNPLWGDFMVTLGIQHGV
jgi:hypothetical protein